MDSTGKLKAKMTPKYMYVKCTKCRLNISEEERCRIKQEYCLLKDNDRKKDFIWQMLNRGMLKEFESMMTRERSPGLYQTCSFSPEMTSSTASARSFSRQHYASVMDLYRKDLKKKSDGGTFTGEDQRGKHTAWNQTPEEKIQLSLC